MNDSTCSNPYPTQPSVHKGPLPDLFAPPGISRVRSLDEWPAAGERWRDMVVDMLFGGMPPAPDSIRVETLNHSIARRVPGSPRLFSYRIHSQWGGKAFSLLARIFVPTGEGPYPVVMNGDACWWHITNEIIEEVVNSGVALLLFNRTELAEDMGALQDPLRGTHLPLGEEPDATKAERKGGLYDFFGDTSFSAMSAWAWGYHRCVDLVEKLPFIDATRIAVSGHSRGAKTAMLAAATDARIALINDNGACAAGSPLFRYVNHGGESLGAIVEKFPTWFNPAMLAYKDREEELPFDQHCFLAALAPRPTLLTYALDDRWSNPEGMILAAEAAMEVYRFLGTEDALCYHLRAGGHAHSLEDWKALMDFIRWKWMGHAPNCRFNAHPYTHLPKRLGQE